MHTTRSFKNVFTVSFGKTAFLEVNYKKWTKN